MNQNKRAKIIKFLLRQWWVFLWAFAVAFFCDAFDINLTWKRIFALLVVVAVIEYSLVQIVVDGVKKRETEKAAEEKAKAEAERAKDSERSRIVTHT